MWYPLWGQSLKGHSVFGVFLSWVIDPLFAFLVDEFLDDGFHDMSVTGLMLG